MYYVSNIFDKKNSYLTKIILLLSILKCSNAIILPSFQCHSQKYTQIYPHFIAAKNKTAI